MSRQSKIWNMKGTQGRGLTSEIEDERRRKISEARQKREAIRRGELIPEDDTDPEGSVANFHQSQTHTRAEIRRLESKYHLKLRGWVGVGPMLVPVFRKGD